ncbi:uncharacterized protein LOC109597011 isoform X2 [Aethina tumida]|uniref:uncharacterized protein LOC109597011 isoform X2 n=1 Tax=Aethina tumida TaxID=116153 RepID=UPI0021491DF0|nr:uncharacterized protein LOC109597011 isoform X2 [Aethina tumida]
MSTSLRFSTLAILFVFFCFAESSAGNCLKYGHACWGAHGKRSGSRDTPFRDDPATKDIVIPKWFLSKMMQDPMDLHYMHNREQEPSFKQHPEQLFSGNDADADAFKALESYDGFDDGLSSDGDFDDSFGKKESSFNSKKPSKLILKKRST